VSTPAPSQTHRKPRETNGISSVRPFVKRLQTDYFFPAVSAVLIIDNIRTIFDLTGPEGLDARPSQCSPRRGCGGESPPQCGANGLADLRSVEGGLPVGARIG